MEQVVRSSVALPDTATIKHWLVPALLVTAAIEFVSLRVLLQSGPALENEPVGKFAIDAVLLIGLTGLSVAVLLAIGLLLLLGLHGLASRDWRTTLTGATTITLTFVLAGAVIPIGPRTSLLLPAMLLSLLIVLLVATTPIRAARTRIVVLLLALTGLAVSIHFTGLALDRRFSITPGGVSFIHVAELLALAGGVAAVLLIRRPISPWALIAGIVAGGSLLAWQVAIPWLPSTVAIWNFGISTFLPAPVYPMVLGVFVCAVVHLFRQQPHVAVALTLIALGGLKWDVAYFNLLGITGVLLLIISLGKNPLLRGGRGRANAP